MCLASQINVTGSALKGPHQNSTIIALEALWIISNTSVQTHFLNDSIKDLVTIRFYHFISLTNQPNSIKQIQAIDGINELVIELTFQRVVHADPEGRLKKRTKHTISISNLFCLLSEALISVSCNIYCFASDYNEGQRVWSSLSAYFRTCSN